MLDQETLNKYRRDIVFDARLRDLPFVFHATWGLFSPRDIDEGTRLLADRLEIEATDNCFDLGCGYGPIGLLMARLAPQGQTLMVDKDFIAVDYSNGNAERNGLDNARAKLSNGFDQVAPNLRFDVIASNIPAKVGKEMLSLYLHDALARMNPGGRLYLVTINGLRQFMKRNLNEVFGNYKKLKQGKSYTVAFARKEG
ncbi:MAG: methyltransferase [gamma proteobacterium endosymbiont of Lamellibrachia anaximandri]|nr:methyltransferase [gamma proteobacterium endosymbiont of Lamellibrachia anaximandri]MBL3617472.1 methyltransferase [gamma proteobacterium endosymbiont of Lamellibrachia anaximandri]